MPYITHHKLIGLPVVTERGTHIGHIRAFDIETESQTIIRYSIKPSGIVSPFFRKRNDLLITANAVVAITEEHMVVRDTVIPVADNSTLSSRLTLRKDTIPLLPVDSAS